MNLEGTIARIADGTVIVTAPNAADTLEFPGVKCLNPRAPPEVRIYAKEFRQKKIYFPREYDLAVKNHISHQDAFVFSMNGYSRISDEQARRYGVKIGAYEEACKAILNNAISHLSSKFKGAALKLIHGASDMGVDLAIQEVADSHNLETLGFSCPRYMLYVKDDKNSVYIAGSRDEYSDSYIRTLDLLITTGGRKQSLAHDIAAACIYNKRIHFVDVLNSLSTTGGVPAVIIDEHGKPQIDNAAAAMGMNISFFSAQDAIKLAPQDGDKWDAIFNNVNSIATAACRQKMAPEKMF